MGGKGQTAASKQGRVAPEMAWLATLVYETLDKVASPASRNALIKAALTSAEQEVLPTGPAALLHFAMGPLRDAVENVLGGAAADAFVQDLEPILQQAAAATDLEDWTPVAADVELEPKSALPLAPAEAPEEQPEDSPAQRPAGPPGDQPERLPAKPLAEAPAQELDAASEAGPAGAPAEANEATNGSASTPAVPAEPSQQSGVGAAPAKRTTLKMTSRGRAKSSGAGPRVEYLKSDPAGGPAGDARRRSTFPYLSAVLQQSDARLVIAVDDQRAFLPGWNTALRALGFEVFTAADVQSAATLSIRLAAECILASATMPELDSELLLRCIGEAAKTRAPLVVLLDAAGLLPLESSDELWLPPRGRSADELVDQLAERLERRRG